MNLAVRIFQGIAIAVLFLAAGAFLAEWAIRQYRSRKGPRSW